MLKQSKSLICVIAATWALGQQAHAQEWRADPILFDNQADTEGQEPLMIVAFTPQNSAPALARSSSTTTAVLPDPNMPIPSIVLGQVDAGQEAAFGILRLLPTTVAQVGFDHDDLDARRALQSANPDLFRQLVTEGHVDPPETILNAAVQTELARMNCYRSRVDNDWGPGSRRSVGEYFAEREDLDWPTQVASPELFRTIVLGPDVECPTPVAAAPAPSRPTTQPQQPAQRPVQQPAPPPPPPEPSSGPQLNIGGSTGVFR